MTLYIFVETLLFLINIYIKNLTTNNTIIDIVRLLPIIINCFLIIKHKKTIDKKILLSFILVLIADICFVLFDLCWLGIYFFIIIQLLYYLYFKDKNINLLHLFIFLITILITIIFQNKIKIIEIIIYVLISLYNIYFSIKNKKEFKNIAIALILLFVYDLFIGINYLYQDNIFKILEYIFYIPSQLILIIQFIYGFESIAYKLLQPIFTAIFKLYYNPTIINKHYIPNSGACVIAGNHKHALDPILVDVCTKRVVHTLAKKDLHDGKFGFFFKAIGTIPVDLHAEHNKSALDSAIYNLNKGNLINLSPEAKRNYTKEILLPFKYGAVVMAKRSNCKIVPYSITGDYKFRSKNLKIVFGKPLDISKLSIEDANTLLFKKVKKLIIDARESEK